MREPTVSSSAGIIDFASSEFATVTQRPILSINTQVVTAVEERRQNFIPITFDLKQNYPNPFNPSTRIAYSLAAQSPVSLKVYDILGSEVATLVNTTQGTGVYEVNFNASNLASGLYFYTLKAGSFTSTKKMMLLK
ncbi:MAG: T9SS type A sorting domain-containing protein [Bacteroidetes bacterium]|nr:T9SS type A sorting domain-containing protein [Bacteroidota bacterium]